MASITLQQVLRTGFDRFRRRYGMRFAVYRWAHSVMACRTAALGGHEWHCPEGHESRVVWNSCKHRACPQCAGLDRARWLDRMCSLLALNCGYHHVVFTVPQELNELWRWNRSWFADQVLAASRETLLQLLGQPKWLGALPGLVQSWHTWGRNLLGHPHAHVLVTAGGWTDSGWKHLRHDYLLPSKVLRAVYRGKLQSRLRAGLSSGEMVLPAGQDVISVRRLLQRLYRKQWSVNVQSRYGHGRGVLTYLGNYVRGGPVREHQLQSLTSTSVTFRHLDHRDKRHRSCTLSIEDFLLRLSEHVPEKGFQAVRYAGLYASSHRALLAQARASLGMAPRSAAPEVLTVQDFLERFDHGDKMCCSTCGRRLVQGARIERSDRAPPYVEYGNAA